MHNFHRPGIRREFQPGARRLRVLLRQSGLNRDTSCTCAPDENWAKGPRRRAPRRRTPAGTEAISRRAGSTVAAPPSGTPRARRQARAARDGSWPRWPRRPLRVRATRRRAASALEVVAPRVAPRFQIGVAVFSRPDHSKPPSPAAHQPARVTVPTAAPAQIRPVSPLFAPVRLHRKARRTPTHDRIDCRLTIASCKDKKAAGNHFPKTCCPNTTRVSKGENDANDAKLEATRLVAMLPPAGGVSPRELSP